MGLLDLFSGAASSKAAKANRAQIAMGQQQSLSALGAARDSAVNLLGTGSGGTALGELQAGYDEARSDISSGYDAAQLALSKLGAGYDHMVEGGRSAFDAYGDASGANGQAGSDRAFAAFRASPGYEFARQQGIDAILANASARGTLASGNTTVDLLKYATGFADQDFQQYVENLRSGANFYPTGLSGQQQGLGQQANAAIGRGTQLGALGVGRGQGGANIFGQSANYQNQYGTNAANVFTNSTNQSIQNNNNEAAAKNAAGANILNAGIGLASLAAGGFGAGAANPFMSATRWKPLNAVGATSNMFGGGGFGGGGSY